MISKTFLVLLASSLLSLVCIQALAAPSPYSNFVVFGDSLSSSGQVADPGGPAGASYRATNRTGPVYLDGQGEEYSAVAPQILGTKLGFSDDQLAGSTSATRASEGLPDGNNWAVGGYRTDQILDSITTTSTAGDRSRPGYLVSNNFRADPHALYYLTGGANDFYQGGATSLDQADAAAGRLVESVQALQQAGARYIMVWLLPDLSLTPLINGSPLQAFISQLSNRFNIALVRQLQTVDAEVIPLNIPALLTEGFSNPAQFGLATDQNLMTTCFSGKGCTENARYGIHSATPAPNKLIYYDAVHPTEAGQHLIADYAYSLLAAPWEITLLPEMAQGILRAHQDELRNQWQADWGNWQGIGQWRGIVAAGGQHQDFGSQRSGASADGNGFNLNIGGSYRLNEDWRVGVLAGTYRQKLAAGSNDSDYKLNTYLGTAFVQYQQSRWWADAAATAGHLDYDNLKRKFDLGANERGEQGDTSGGVLAFSARLGYNIAQQTRSPWYLSPFISADYARTKVDGYSEDGSDSTALSFDDQKRSSRRLGIGLLGKYQITPETQVFGEIAHEKEYENDTQKLTMALNSLPDNHYTLKGYTPQTNLNRLDLGVSHKLTQDLALRANYNIRKDDDFTQQGLNVGVSLDF
ncbi:esterase EstP [Pseudomonas sp. M30-35]|uniref:esterase EstP n=1 Tax=Pseudomonas sp. M30-35 TaxID=1981174 RepID=UPI000B3D314F|nr:esterase EstP [Pseudomonas sp. M30-35]ARU87768.1 autotransporter domain-containing esterase [Pseudomonas sp. M30-35]